MKTANAGVVEMKAATILRAIDSLNFARDLLYGSDYPIVETTRAGYQCHLAAIMLRHELEHDFPEINIETAAAVSGDITGRPSPAHAAAAEERVR